LRTSTACITAASMLSQWRSFDMESNSIN